MGAKRDRKEGALNFAFPSRFFALIAVKLPE
jgi:hypothetical protein